MTSRAAFYWKNMLSKGATIPECQMTGWLPIYTIYYIYRVIHIQRCFATSHFFNICGDEITSKAETTGTGVQNVVRVQKKGSRVTFLTDEICRETRKVADIVMGKSQQSKNATNGSSSENTLACSPKLAASNPSRKQISLLCKTV